MYSAIVQAIKPLVEYDKKLIELRIFEDENGTLLPMGVYGLKREDGSIETLTIIR